LKKKEVTDARVWQLGARKYIETQQINFLSQEKNKTIQKENEIFEERISALKLLSETYNSYEQNAVYTEEQLLELLDYWKEIWY
jgi:hypothetical protein